MKLDDLASITTEGSKKPDFVEAAWYFFLERGVSLEEFNRLPIPYIVRMMEIHAYIEKEKDRKSKKKGR